MSSVGAIREPWAGGEQFRLLLEHAPAAIAMFDRQMRYVLVSKRWMTDYRLGDQDIVGRSHYDVFPEIPERWKAIHQRCLAGAVETCDADAFPRADGTVDWVRWDIHPWRDRAGEIGGIIMFTEVINERRHAAEALRASEEQYRDLVENINDVIYAADAHGVITYVSPVVESSFGFTPAELIGRSFADIAHPEDVADLAAAFYQTLHGRVTPTEWRAFDKQGTVRWVRSFSRPIVTGNRTVGLRGVLTEITETKRAEVERAALLNIAKEISGKLDFDEILRHVHKRTAAVLGCERIGTFYWDAARQVYRHLSQYGLPADLEPDANALALVPGMPIVDQLAKGDTVVLNDIENQDLFPVELLRRFRLTAVAAVPLSVRGRMMGALVATSSTTGRGFQPREVELLEGIANQCAVAIEAADLYQSQRDEAEVASALARVGSAMISSLNTPQLLERLCQVTAEVLSCDFSHTFLRLTEEETFAPVSGHGDRPEQWEAMRLLRIPRAMIARLVERLEQDEVAQIIMSEPQDLMPAGLPMQFGVTMACYIALRRGGQVFGIQTAGYRGRQQPFTPQQLRIARGIGQLASVALQNARLVEELEAANRFKSEFLGNMSHELRSPLNVILGYGGLLLDGSYGSLAPEQVEPLRRMEKSARELLDLITATLDLSRFETKRIPVDCREVRVADLFDELAAEGDALSTTPAVVVEWNVGSDVPLLHTDALKLKMILKNLVGNALKFTGEGRVTVQARGRDDGVEFVVSDTGIGIPAHLHSAIFEPFRQGDSPVSQGHGGVGLGLYIVRRLLEVLGGTITLESEVGRGSTFRVWVPASVQTERRS